MSSAIFARAAEEWARMRTAYGDYLEAHIVAAETATNANLLSAKGRARGVTVEQLFTAARPVAEAWASEELRDFWAKQPRMTLAQFEQQWVLEQVEPYDWDSPVAA